MSDFDFISTTDRPALILISNSEWVNFCKNVLMELGYKVHSLDNYEEFMTRFGEVHYEVVIVDEAFGGSLDNPTLQLLQSMSMTLRRHAAILLLGGSFETLNAMQAFQQSVHAVINYTEMALLPQLVQKVVSDNDMFLKAYRETNERVVHSRNHTSQ
jgi:DNA-binding NtrC family response regulator